VRPRNQAGFTLIEMMVALALFSFAIVGILSVATAMSGNVKEQRQVVQTETDVRAPMDFLADTLRMASPSIQSGNIQDATIAGCTIVAAGFTGVGGLSVLDSNSAPDQLDVVFAYGSSVATLQTPYTVGTQTSITITNDHNQASQIFPGDKLLLSNTAQGTIVSVSLVNTGTGVITLNTAACAPTLPTGGYAGGSLVLRVMRARFSVGTVDNIPTLMMDPDADGPLAAQPLAEGIEDMQIAVGTDADGNGSISAAEWANSSTTGALVGPIRAVRLTLISRSNSALAGVATAGQRKAAENRPAGAADAYRRRYLTQTIEVRNLGGSP